MLSTLRMTDIAMLVLAIPVLASALYLAVLSLCSARPAAPAGDQSTFFDIVVPAHNEERGIAATIASLRAMEYPPDRFRILVIADNCVDGTARIARDAGAIVLERTHATERGKGYALAHAYEHSLAAGLAIAIVVIDADTSVTTNLLSAFSARFAAGAHAVQAEYGVRNPLESWRTRLMVVALAMFHTVRSLGRERLELSCGLRGNGMAFSTAVIRRVPPRAFSIVEDVEYGAALGLERVRVMYVAEAEVHGDMPASSAASRTQRERWEGGRLELIRTLVPSLMRAARGRDRSIPFDLALDLLVPPLTLLAGLIMLGTMVSISLSLLGLAGAVGYAPWLIAAACLALYVVRGAVVSGVGPRVVFDLAWAPVYAIWKISLLLRPKRVPGEWVRTARSDEIVP